MAVKTKEVRILVAADVSGWWECAGWRGANDQQMRDEVRGGDSTTIQETWITAEIGVPEPLAPIETKEKLDQRLRSCVENAMEEAMMLSDHYSGEAFDSKWETMVEKTVVDIQNLEKEKK